MARCSSMISRKVSSFTMTLALLWRHAVQHCLRQAAQHSWDFRFARRAVARCAWHVARHCLGLRSGRRAVPWSLRPPLAQPWWLHLVLAEVEAVEAVQALQRCFEKDAQQCLDACPRSLRSRGLEHKKWLRTILMARVSHVTPGRPCRTGEAKRLIGRRYLFLRARHEAVCTKLVAEVLLFCDD